MHLYFISLIMVTDKSDLRLFNDKCWEGIIVTLKWCTNLSAGGFSLISCAFRYALNFSSLLPWEFARNLYLINHFHAIVLSFPKCVCAQTASSCAFANPSALARSLEGDALVRNAPLIACASLNKRSLCVALGAECSWKLSYCALFIISHYF